MGITRQSIYRGPGRLKLGSLAIDDKDGISLASNAEMADIGSSLNGFLGAIRTGTTLTAGLTPYGHITQALLDALYPAWMRTPVIGSSIFGATDTACTIHSRAGKLITLFCAAITKPASLTLSAVATAFGALEITALLANGKLPGEDGSLIKVEDSAWTGGTAQPRPQTGSRYSARFGDLDISETAAGFTAEFPVTTEPVPSDNAGTLDLTFGGVKPTVRCQPLALSETDILALLNLNAPRGSYAGSGKDLTVTGTGGLTLTLRNCDVLQGPLNWGATKLRAGELLFQASPDPETGNVFDIAFTTT